MIDVSENINSDYQDSSNYSYLSFVFMSSFLTETLVSKKYIKGTEGKWVAYRLALFLEK